MNSAIQVFYHYCILIAISFIRCIRILLGPAGVCRFTITCTQYAHEQLETQPLHRALWNIIRRALACQPFSTVMNDVYE